ncbi:hypothetical protein BC628DRAFT_981929 [Trametes gibbosa]|nr:hypothetical protein BC628DRAFT_981929 [Trametes gibbosa]
MDGVRRWMGNAPSTGLRTSRVDRTQDPKSKKAHSAAETVPESLPEIVMKLLDPIVEEEDEYQLYIEQGQELLVTSSEDIDYLQPIYSKYLSAVNLAQGLAEPSELQDKDEKIMAAYLGRAKPHGLSEIGFTSLTYEKIIAELTTAD